jgi:penicillin-binding protein 1C
MARVKRRLKTFSLLILLFFLLSAGFFTIWISTFKIPDLESFEQRKVTESTKIYDRTGEVLLYDIFQDIKRTVIPLEEISVNIQKATLAIEDVNFYNHRGVEPRAIVRAILVNIGALKFSQGGSTVTQQVVKNSILTSEKKISRKIKEWVLALKLENFLTKDKILALYLNEIPYGGNIYGVEEASQAFFGKPASEVTLAEAAHLAALPKAPTFYSPYRNRDELEERKNLVLREMLRNNFITQEGLEEALEETVVFRQREDQGIKAPHFVMFVRDILEKKYGEEVLVNGGLRVITTLDYDMQKRAEELALEFAQGNQEKFNAENIALVAVDPRNGHILTMVGSRDYFDEDIDGNFNITTAHRQPGSAFKPFAYAAAFNKGYTPDTILFDLPTVFSANCTPQGEGVDCYMPQNYDQIFRGPMTMREALAQSVNVPSVKTMYLAGLRETLSLAKVSGIQSLEDIGRYGLTLVLGGGEVSLLDLTSAYGVFANSGARVPYQGILEIRGKNEKVLERTVSQLSFVIPQETTWKISDILSDNVARAPAFGESSFLHFPGREVAVKTGTTNDYRDAWIVGYTPSLAVGAWAGNNDNRPMEKKVAGFIIAPFWNAFMREVLPNLPQESFIKLPKEDSYELKPALRGIWQGGQSTLIDNVSGKLATEYTPQETLSEVIHGETRTVLYWLSKDNPRGPIPEHPELDPQFKLWDYAVQQWVLRRGVPTQILPNLPKEFDDVHLPENFPKVSIQTPTQGNTYSNTETISVDLKTESKFPIGKVEYFINDAFLESRQAPNLTFSFIPQELGLEGEILLKVVVYDKVFNKGELETSFRVIRDSSETQSDKTQDDQNNSSNL